MSDTPASLPFGLPCDPPLGAYSCACSTCSLDNTVACNSNADCPGLGVCRTDGLHGGALRVPDKCQFPETFDDMGGGEGQCSGPLSNNMFCDGFVRGDGSGVLVCANNADCGTYGVPGAGNCTLDQPLSCFLDPIVATGSATPQGATLGATYCVPPTGGGAVNSAFGFPGPARLVAETEYSHFCADGVTAWSPGGASCP
jgi:hypothetical protein